MHVLATRTRRRAAMLVLGLASGLLAPQAVSAKTTDPATVVVVGPVDLAAGHIVVNGYDIAPAGAFRPSILEQGDVVVITGVLLRDGVTIRTTNFELFVSDE